MQSRTSFFNRTLFRKNLSRFWPLWGLASFGGALFPLAMLINLLHNGFAFWSPLETTQVYYSVLSSAVPVISLVYAALCAMAVWSYLYSARSVGLMHTLPIRREGLFLTNVLSGLAMMIIPYAVTGALTVLVSLLYGGFEPVGVLVTVLGVLGESVFFFGLATFCALIVGNVFMLPALYGLLNFIAVLTDFAVNLLAGGFCFGLSGSYSGAVEWLSPIVYLMQQVYSNYSFERQWVTDAANNGRYEDSVMTSVTLENGWLIGVYAAVGVVLLVLAWLLYRRRRSESAGDVVAVGWMKPVFRYGWAAFSAVLGGRLLYALFWESFQHGVYLAAVPMILCMIVGGAIGYYAASMLLAKTPRVFKNTWKGLLAVVLGCIALVAVLRFDVFGVERRVPAADTLEEVNLYAAGSNYYLIPGKDDALIEQVRALHKAIIDDKDYVQNPYPVNYYDASGRIHEIPAASSVVATSDAGVGSVGTNDNTYTWLRITYTLSSGLKVERLYEDLYLTRARMAQEGTYDNLLDRLINSTEMRQKRIRWQDKSFALSSAWFSSRSDGRDLNSQEVNTILDAVVRDAENGTWGVYDWFADSSDADAYNMRIDINYHTVSGREDRYDNVSITVRPAMTETVQTLKDLGLITDADLVTNAEMRPWEYTSNGWDEYDRFYSTYGISPEQYYEQYGTYPEGWFTPAADEAAAVEAASKDDGGIGAIGGADGPTEIVTTA